MSRLIKQINEKLKFEYENTKDVQDRAKIVDNPAYFAKLLLWNIAIAKDKKDSITNENILAVISQRVSLHSRIIEKRDKKDILLMQQMNANDFNFINRISNHFKGINLAETTRDNTTHILDDHEIGYCIEVMRSAR